MNNKWRIYFWQCCVDLVSEKTVEQLEQKIARFIPQP
jgi:hypothetical protein